MLTPVRLLTSFTVHTDRISFRGMVSINHYATSESIPFLKISLYSGAMPLSLHVPRTKTQPGKYRNLAGLVLYSLSIAFQSIFVVRFPYTDTVLPSVRHRKSSLTSSVLHHMGHQPQVSFHQNVSCLQVPLRRQFQIMPLFLGAQGFGKASGMELQRVKQAAEQQPDACKHTSSPQHYPILHFPRIFRRGQAEFSVSFVFDLPHRSETSTIGYGL